MSVIFFLQGNVESAGGLTIQSIFTKITQSQASNSLLIK